MKNKEAANSNHKEQGVKTTPNERVYANDKNGWVIFKNQFKKKVKLRMFIKSRAKDLCYLDGYNIKTAREILIKAYDEGGIDAVDKLVNLEFLKEVEITFDEMKELEEVDTEIRSIEDED